MFGGIMFGESEYAGSGSVVSNLIKNLLITFKKAIGFVGKYVAKGTTFTSKYSAKGTTFTDKYTTKNTKFKDLYPQD